MKWKCMGYLLGVWFSMLGSGLGLAQSLDYHRNDSPSVSWNGISVYDPRQMALGGVLILSEGPLSVMDNPASSLENPGLSLGMGMGLVKHQAVQFYGVNTGVFYAPEGLSQTQIFPGAISGRWVSRKGWGIFAGYGVRDLLQWPDFQFNFLTSGFRGTFSGSEQNLFAGISLRCGSRITLGLKFDYGWGRQKSDLTEYWAETPLDLTDREVNNFDFCRITGALRWQLSGRWKMLLVLNYPLTGRIDRARTEWFSSELTEFEIFSESAQDSFYRPPRALLSTSLDLRKRGESADSDRLTIGMQVLYTGWQEYRLIEFSRDRTEPLRNTWTVSWGAEYAWTGKKFTSFNRLGYCYDPQPLLTPRAALHTITGGYGLQWKSWSLDLGMAIYLGSAGSIPQRHFLTSLSVAYRWTR